MTAPIGLLDSDEPPAWSILREAGKSPFVLVCDHASNRLPRRLGTLGLHDHELQRHIGWDIGAAAVATLLAASLDAVAIFQTYSRLAIDCNRPPEVPSSIAEISEYTAIPGNRSLSQAQKDMRLNEIFLPYHDRIRAELDRRRDNGLPTALVAMHSFTPVFKGARRPWHAGVLYNRDDRLAKPMIELLRREADLEVGDNEPYALGDDSDYTIPVHGERRGLPHVEIEIRQDLIAEEAGQRAWCDRLTRILAQSWQALSS